MWPPRSWAGRNWERRGPGLWRMEDQRLKQGGQGSGWRAEAKVCDFASFLSENIGTVGTEAASRVRGLTRGRMPI